MIALALACSGGGAVDTAAVVEECAGTGATEVAVLTRVAFSRIEDGVTQGYDLDDDQTKAGDPWGCGIQDYVDADGNEGIDNAFGQVIPALESTQAVVLEDLISESINSGELLLMLELDDLNSDEDDACVDLTIQQALGTPNVGNDGEVESGQTFDRDPDSPIETVATSVVAGRIDSPVFDYRLPLQVFREAIDFDIYNARARVVLNGDGTVSGFINGGVSADYVMEIANRDGIGDDVAATLEPVVMALRDLDRDGDGECEDISVVLEFDGKLAFFYE